MVTVTSLRPLSSARRVASVVEVRDGDTVVADDGVVGCVDRAVRSETGATVYLIVSIAVMVQRKRYPVVPASLVMAVDRSRSLVRVRGTRRMIGRLPETLPLVI
jgi:hypothetical protein